MYICINFYVNVDYMFTTLCVLYIQYYPSRVHNYLHTRAVHATSRRAVQGMLIRARGRTATAEFADLKRQSRETVGVEPTPCVPTSLLFLCVCER